MFEILFEHELEVSESSDFWFSGKRAFVGNNCYPVSLLPFEPGQRQFSKFDLTVLTIRQLELRSLALHPNRPATVDPNLIGEVPFFSGEFEHVICVSIFVLEFLARVHLDAKRL